MLRKISGIAAVGLTALFTTALPVLAGDPTPGVITNVQLGVNGTTVRIMAVSSYLNLQPTGTTSINYPTWSFSGKNSRIVFNSPTSVSLFSTGTLLPSRAAATAEINVSTVTGYPVSYKVLKGDATAGSSGVSTNGQLKTINPSKGATSIVAPK